MSPPRLARTIARVLRILAWLTLLPWSALAAILLWSVIRQDHVTDVSTAAAAGMTCAMLIGAYVVVRAVTQIISEAEALLQARLMSQPVIKKIRKSA